MAASCKSLLPAARLPMQLIRTFRELLVDHDALNLVYSSEPVHSIHRHNSTMASWREVARPLRQLRISQISRPVAPRANVSRWYSAQGAATAPAPAEESDPLQQLETDEKIYMPEPTPDQLETYREPWKRAKQRKTQLPASRCVTEMCCLSQGLHDKKL